MIDVLLPDKVMSTMADRKTKALSIIKAVRCFYLPPTMALRPLCWINSNKILLRIGKQRYALLMLFSDVNFSRLWTQRPPKIPTSKTQSFKQNVSTKNPVTFGSTSTFRSIFDYTITDPPAFDPGVFDTSIANLFFTKSRGSNSS